MDPVGSATPVKTAKRMTFGRFTMIVVITAILMASIIEFAVKGESLTHYIAGVVTGYVIVVAGTTLVIVALLLLARRALRSRSDWPYWCGAVVLILVSLITVLAAFKADREGVRTDGTPIGSAEGTDRYWAA
jgi:hypothetical protein